MASMQWQRLLARTRLGREERDTAPMSKGRSVFQQDLDRVVFCSAFRRLQNKTQVHSFPGNDHVRNRLTHSIEVASVGRSLGTLVGLQLPHICAAAQVSPEELGHIVHAAALMHDIGNPPFGHSGEEAIRHWFCHWQQPCKKDLNDAQRLDFEFFEGNAQGLRILTQLENHTRAGGLQLTYATLAAFTKYPCTAAAIQVKSAHADYIGIRKNGIYMAELEAFARVAEHLGLVPLNSMTHAWARHPLVYLLEAADDICYVVVDLEDAVELGIVPDKQVREYLLGFLPSDERESLTQAKIGRLRAKVIGCLIEAVAHAFVEHEQAMLAGAFNDELLNVTAHASLVREIKDFARDHIFQSTRKTTMELSGYTIIHGLLDAFADLVPFLKTHQWDLNALRGKHQKLAQVMGLNELEDIQSTYDALLRVTDYVGGMTDRFALDMYRSLNGYTLGG